MSGKLISDFDKIADVLNLFPIQCLRKITIKKENKHQSETVFKAKSKKKIVEYLSKFEWNEDEYLDLRRHYVNFSNNRDGISQYIATIDCNDILNVKEVLTKIQENSVKYDNNGLVEKNGFKISNEIINTYKNYDKDSSSEPEPFTVIFWSKREKMDVLPDYSVYKAKYNIHASIRFDLKEKRIFFNAKDYPLVTSAKSAVIKDLKIPLADHIISNVTAEKARSMFDLFIAHFSPNEESEDVLNTGDQV